MLAPPTSIHPWPCVLHHLYLYTWSSLSQGVNGSPTTPDEDPEASPAEVVATSWETRVPRLAEIFDRTFCAIVSDICSSSSSPISSGGLDLSGAGGGCSLLDISVPSAGRSLVAIHKHRRRWLDETHFQVLEELLHRVSAQLFEDWVLHRIRAQLLEDWVLHRSEYALIVPHWILTHVS